MSDQDLRQASRDYDGQRGDFASWQRYQNKLRRTGNDPHIDTHYIRHLAEDIKQTIHAVPYTLAGFSDLDRYKGKYHNARVMLTVWKSTLEPTHQVGFFDSLRLNVNFGIPISDDPIINGAEGSVRIDIQQSHKDEDEHGRRRLVIQGEAYDGDRQWRSGLIHWQGWMPHDARSLLERVMEIRDKLVPVTPTKEQLDAVKNLKLENMIHDIMKGSDVRSLVMEQEL